MSWIRGQPILIKVRESGSIDSKPWMDRIILLDDAAVTGVSQTEDVLSMGGLVRVVANSLRRAQGPMVIHVDGGWGRGKTSFCKVLEAELRPVEFDNGAGVIQDEASAADDLCEDHRIDVAWYVASDQDGPPEDAVLFGIAMAITKGDRDEALSIVRTWGRVGDDEDGSGVARREAFRSWASRSLGWVDDPLIGEPDVSLGNSRVGEDASDEINEPPMEMAYVIQPASKRTAVLIIDDLDRCTPEWTLRVLNAVRLYVTCKGLAFVIAADRKVIDGAFAQSVEALGAEGIRHSGDAMEKYIRHRIQIPSLAETKSKDVQTSMKVFQNRLFGETGYEILCGPTADFKDGIGTTLALTCNSSLTLRRLKRILNELAMRLGREADHLELTAERIHKALDEQEEQKKR